MSGSRWKVRAAIGDPQAPIETFFHVLERHGLLGADGRLRPDVFLVSMGDHFDYGTREQRDEAATSSLRLLEWLAAHPEEQVVILAGNHDLARVGELAGFDDASFAAAQKEADLVYAQSGGEPDHPAEQAFRAKYPQVPTAELVARDFSNFRVAQRELVHGLLASGRMRAAWGVDDLLFSHAGVTSDAVPSGAGAEAIAASVQDRFARAFAAYAKNDAASGRPFAVPSLPHWPGSAERGEGDGIFYHRPSAPSADGTMPARRFDPRRLPLGVTQVIGHIGDGKSRKLLGAAWTDGAPDRHGVLRHLVTDGASVHYAHGTPERTSSDQATMIFVDGGMAKAAPGTYELFDLDTRAALVSP
jgi:hypothetical protein